MRRLNLLLTIVLVCMLAGCRAHKKTIRLAFIQGMNPIFNYEMYEPLLTSMNKVSWNAYNNISSQELFKSIHSNEYDVIVFSDICLEEFPESSQADLVKLVSEGKPVLILHDGLLTYNTWPEFAKIAGMKYFMSAQEVDGVPYGVSTYKHEQELPIQVIDQDHYITRGMKENFTFHDEIYGKLYKSPDIHPLWITTHPDSEEVVMYTHQYGKGKVVGIVTGHGPDIYKDKNFQYAIDRAIRWLVK